MAKVVEVKSGPARGRVAVMLDDDTVRNLQRIALSEGTTIHQALRKVVNTAPSAETHPGTARLSVLIDHASADALREAQMRTGKSLPQILRRAIAVYKWVTRAQFEGKAVFSLGHDGRREVLPDQF